MTVNRRVTPNSKTGRALIRVGKTFYPTDVTPEIAAWNRQVELKKAAKKAAKAQRPSHK